MQKVQPSAAIIDFQLPDFNGNEVCSRLRKSYTAPLKIIVFTMEEDRAIHRQCIESGADSVITKSSNASEVIESVQKLLTQA